MRKNGSPPSLEKEAYRIGEVSALTQLEAYTLRYWESEFPALHPAKTPHGQRLYRRQDVETVLAIKQLLYEQGFTIAGARKQLETSNGNHAPAAPDKPAAAPRKNANGHAQRVQLRAIRAELADLLTLLSRR